MTTMPAYSIPPEENAFLIRVSDTIADTANCRDILSALRALYTDEANKGYPNAMAIAEKYLFRAYEMVYFAYAEAFDGDVCDFFFNDEYHDRVLTEARAHWNTTAGEQALTEAATLVSEGRFTLAGEQFKLAALAGNPNGMLNYGVTLSKGDGVPRDELEASFWYWFAGREGNVKGMMYLALNYRKGEGVHKDGMNMIYWYLRAALAGNNEALLACASCLTQGIGIPNLQELGAKLLSAAMKMQNKENVTLIAELLHGLREALEPHVYNK